MRSTALMSGVVAVALGGCTASGQGLFGVRSALGVANLAKAEPLFSEKEDKCLERPDKLLALIVGQTADAQKDLECKQIVDQMRKVIGAKEVSARPTENRLQSAEQRSQSTTERNELSPVIYDKRQRNEIIDSLIASSNQKCSSYSAMLKNTDGAVNASLSLAAILTGGLGSILGGAATAKALSGSSAIPSGSRAALNETYVSNQTIHVLTSAYEKVRQAQRRTITNRQACEVDKYSLMRGFEDAFAYHSSCSVLAGLAETARAVDRSDNPGIVVMRQQVAELAGLRRQLASVAAGDGAELDRVAPSKADLNALRKISTELDDTRAKYELAQPALQALKDSKVGTVDSPPATDAGSAGPAGDWVADAADTVERRAAKVVEQTKRKDDLKKRVAELSVAQQNAIDDVAGTVRVTVVPEADENWSCPIRTASSNP